ncbi:WD40 repeat-like protein, partial [Suillus decipiens]
DSISAAVLPNRQHMVTSLDKTLYLSHLTTRKVLKHLVGHPSDVSGLAVSRDERFIASCDTTGGIILWNGETGVCLLGEVKPLTSQNGHAKSAITLDAVVHCIRYSHSGNRLAIATKDHICIYDAVSHQRVKTLKGNSGGSFTLAWTHDGTYLLSGGGRYDPTVRVWDVSKGDEIEVFHGHINKINAISVNDSNTMITSASCDGSFRLW